jgi:hypothetical protein
MRDIKGHKSRDTADVMRVVVASGQYTMCTLVSIGMAIYSV